MKYAVCSFLIILCATLSQAIASQDTTRQTGYAVSEKFDPKRDAGKDIQTAIAEARKSGKRILLDVGGEWCIWCRRLDTLFMQNKDLDDFLHKNYVKVKINFSQENENEKALSQYPKIKGYPHLFVLGSNGKLIHSQETGALESGKHHDPAKVLRFLKNGPKNRG